MLQSNTYNLTIHSLFVVMWYANMLDMPAKFEIPQCYKPDTFYNTVVVSIYLINECQGLWTQHIFS